MRTRFSFARIATAAVAGTGLATVGMTAIAGAAAASGPPVGGCSAPYQLFAISSAPPDVQPALVKIDRNGDGYICVKPYPGNAGNTHRAPYNGIDNTDMGVSN